jgi:hypothetical protein
VHLALRHPCSSSSHLSVLLPIMRSIPSTVVTCENEVLRY